MDVFWQQPPVTRTIVAAAIVTSICVYGRFIPAYSIAFIPEYIYKKAQLWRLATSFWLTGPKFSMLMDPVFLYQYSNAIETQSPRFNRKGDFFVYIVFVKAVILLLSGLLLGNFIFMDALLLALAYTFAQENPNRPQTFIILTFTSRYLPYVMLALTFIMTGGDMSRVYNQATGLIAAHAYDFLTRIWPRFGGGRNWIEWATPRAMWRSFSDGRTGQDRVATSMGAGTAFRAPASAAEAGGGTTYSSGSTWGARGQGRRLG